MDNGEIIKLRKTMVLAIGVSEEKEILALGYHLYDLRTRKDFGNIDCKTGNGCTQIEFDDVYAFTGARNDNYVYVWDLRNDTQPVGSFYRNADTSQRMYFSYDKQSKSLVTGSLDGTITVYDVFNQSIKAHFPLMFD
mmetsp:Transcript_18589/g.16466  ORF Transcript_18589/g.16466 Transcript_18589/m.16466 type:complete len:137 (+) Transcript_18589:466-876(+)